MADIAHIQVQPRSVTGRRVEQLRREGVLPATVYGRGLDSVTVQLPYTAARDLLNNQGPNTLMDLTVEGEASSRPVVIRQISQDPVSRSLLHLEFYQVDMARPLQASVPVVTSGIAPAVSRYGGMVVQVLDRVLIEALPADFPDQVVVDLAPLTTLESQIHVRDVVPPSGVKLIGDQAHLVVQVQRTRASTSAAAAAAPAPAKKK